jgi:hypothetical protein
MPQALTVMIGWEKVGIVSITSKQESKRTLTIICGKVV